MSASEARILANQQNSQRSTGPKTVEGKEQSRRNAIKHGLTGTGVVMPEADTAEVERRAAVFAEELNATGEVGFALARHAALNSVRMERGADQQTAALTERVRQVDAEFVAPVGASAEEAARLRSEAARRAMFDPSKEATLARRYEAAASREFFRSLKELRQIERSAHAVARVDANLEAQAMLASFWKIEEDGRKLDKKLAEMQAELDRPPVRQPSRSPHLSQIIAGVDVPFTIGRRR